jgi:hypothetical protein
MNQRRRIRTAPCSRPACSRSRAPSPPATLFTPLHLGHGGCGEGLGPAVTPKVDIQRGPFADDAPVSRKP